MLLFVLFIEIFYVFMFYLPVLYSKGDLNSWTYLIPNIKGLGYYIILFVIKAKKHHVKNEHDNDFWVAVLSILYLIVIRNHRAEFEIDRTILISKD